MKNPLTDWLRIRKLRRQILVSLQDQVRPWTSFSEEELHWIFDPRKPFGDVYAAQFFLSDYSRAVRYVLLLEKYFSLTTDLLNREEEAEFSDDVPRAVDPLLGYLIRVMVHVIEAKGLTPACASAFLAIPRERCWRETLKEIRVLESNKVLIEWLGDTAAKCDS